jgi:hypothetical protein
MKSDFGFENWLSEILIGLGTITVLCKFFFFKSLQVLIGIGENKGEDTLMI